MEENKVNVTEPMNAEANKGQELPANPSVWTKIKNFLCQDIKLELTPKQEKVFKEVHDFWTQDVLTGDDVTNFLTQEITWQSTKDFWLQKIDITL